MPQRHRTCRSKPTAKTLLSSDGQTGQTRSLISPTDDGGRDLPGTCCDPTPGTPRFYSCRRISGSKHVNKREKKKTGREDARPSRAPAAGRRRQGRGVATRHFTSASNQLRGIFASFRDRGQSASTVGRASQQFFFLLSGGSIASPADGAHRLATAATPPVPRRARSVSQSIAKIQTWEKWGISRSGSGRAGGHGAKFPSPPRSGITLFSHAGADAAITLCPISTDRPGQPAHALESHFCVAVPVPGESVGKATTVVHASDRRCRQLSALGADCGAAAPAAALAAQPLSNTSGAGGRDRVGTCSFARRSSLVFTVFAANRSPLSGDGHCATVVAL
jgi:hypothetical protein